MEWVGRCWMENLTLPVHMGWSDLAKASLGVVSRGSCVISSVVPKHHRCSNCRTASKETRGSRVGRVCVCDHRPSCSTVCLWGQLETKDPLCPEAHSSCGGAERGSEESDTGLHQTDGVVFCFAVFFSIQRDILQGQRPSPTYPVHNSGKPRSWCLWIVEIAKEFKAGRKSLAESHTATAVKGWSPETLRPTPGAPFAWQKATSYRNITLLLFAMGFNLYKHMKSPPAAYIVAGFAETQHFLSRSSFEENRSLIA
ncbi:uncharacterized protein LOC134523242 [Chroicocephalus ridibundus]|uniref:uncharacterized protein LOC134523242 n=1 Tax=Chroicocephalus ridibundus TaxID=1192867 RepID=UPI002FDD11BA